MGRAKGGVGAAAVGGRRATTKAPAPHSLGQTFASQPASGRVPDLKIQYTEDGISNGRYIVGARQKEAVDVVRNTLALGGRSLLFHGPASSGKSALIEQLSAILRFPLVDLGTVNETEAMTVRLSAGERTTDLTLDKNQLAALAALAKPVVLHVRAEDANLQAVLAHALATKGTRLSAVELEDGEAVGEAGIVDIHPDASAVFEVREEAGETNPSLEFWSVCETAPVAFTPLNEQEWLYKQSMASRTAEGAEWAAAEPQVPATEEEINNSGMAPEYVATVKEVVRSLERAQLAREKMIDDLCGWLKQRGPAGHDFADRWLSTVELQAFLGDDRAERTLMLGLEIFLSPAQRDRGLREAFGHGNGFVEDIQNYVRDVFDAGYNWREENFS